MSSALFVAFMVLTGTITTKEADVLQRTFAGARIPNTWTGVIQQIEECLGRKLTI